MRLMYKSGSVEGLIVETVAKGGSCACQSFSSFVLFQIIQGNVITHL